MKKIELNLSDTEYESLKYRLKYDKNWRIRESINDIINNQVELRTTDLQNTKTDLANHNNKSLQELLTEFRKIREQTIKILQSINDEIVFKSALHPRLKTPMRTMDLFLFVAEHDDHHLDRITELLLINKLENNAKESKI